MDSLNLLPTNRLAQENLIKKPLYRGPTVDMLEQIVKVSELFVRG